MTTSVVFCSVALALLALVGATMKPVAPGEYGVDYSYPIHHYIDAKISPHHAKYYDEQMAGCAKLYSQRECVATERTRLEMNLNQPRTQHNYTEIGFKKRKLPEGIWKELLQFYEDNKNSQHLESWPRGYTYVNTWESPSYMISLEDRALRGGMVLKQRVWDAVMPIIEEWTGKKLTPTSQYGIRVYRDKAILATHVDRLPLVSSCIINVAQDLNEPWPIEVYDHAGRAHNVTMEPGDMVLYESHTVLHGRPFPLNGSYYANLFVHYQPIDHDQVNEEDRQKAAEAARQKSLSNQALNFFGVNSNKRQPPRAGKIGGHEQDQHEAHEIQKHLDAFDAEEREREERRSQNKESFGASIKKIFSAEKSELEMNEELYEEEKETVTPDELLRRTASRGHIEGVVRILKVPSNAGLIHAPDENGWQVLHEAVRGGHLSTVKYLVEMGADLGAKIAGGGTPLWVAREYLQEDSEVVQYLVDIGAPDSEEEHTMQAGEVVEQLPEGEEGEEQLPEEEQQEGEEQQEEEQQQQPEEENTA